MSLMLHRAIGALRLASRLGVETAQPLVDEAPLLSELCGGRMLYVRGWREFDGCVKAFSALGLLAEQVQREEKALDAMAPESLREARFAFLAARGRSRADVAAGQVDPYSLAVWRAFAGRTIVCSTSANMGLSLHQALRLAQRASVRVDGQALPLLGRGEGSLRIWCPDPRADFMSPEKAAALAALEAEEPKLTTLKLYLNRRQRDPAALRDALSSGGYFFPTNPQSREELERLLAEASQGLDPADPPVARALSTLGARLDGGVASAGLALDAGLLGMAVPYLLLLEEALVRGGERAVSVWNPASIGAALAGLVLADRAVREGTLLNEMEEFAPRLAAFAREGGLRKLETRIHGVFDIANLQSLAQLFGVVATRHFSGRQTAYVGLGSSSYAVGNLCFDALRASAEEGGPFRGKESLHPATHTLNPVAQALAFGDDVLRAARRPEPGGAAVPSPCRKPEPAGAAALAGYLLALLDGGALTAAELARALKTAGFTAEAFLEFAGLEEAAFLRQAAEEGPPMEALARELLAWLRRPAAELREAAAKNRVAARPFDDAAFEAREPAIHINMTGDGTAQPSPDFVARLVHAARETECYP